MWNTDFPAATIALFHPPQKESAMSNPYQSPQPFPSGPLAGMPGGEDREKMKSIARYQRLVIFALLANIGLNIVSFAARGAMGGQGGIIFSLVILVAALAVIAFSITSMFLLANTLHNPIVGVLCACLMIIPCVSLITLLIINQQATTFLTSRGVKVGFMGVDPNSI